MNVLTEDKDRDFLLQAGADFVEKLVQLLLLLLRALSEDQEFSHFLLEVGRQVKLLHGSVSYVDLVLELSLLGSAAFNQNSHVSKQGGIDDSHCNQDCGTDQDFHVGSWAHLVSTQEEYSVVVVHNISVEQGLSVESVELGVLSSPHEVQRRDPILLSLAHEVPKTSEYMQD